MGGFLADAGTSDALLLIAPTSQRVFWRSSPDWTNRPVDAENPWYDWVLSPRLRLSSRAGELRKSWRRLCSVLLVDSLVADAPT